MTLRTTLIIALIVVLGPWAGRSYPEDRPMNQNSLPAQPARAAEFESLSPVVELRQYTLHPGQRDALIDLFEREFIESQEALGARVIGEFRDLDNPDLFVWLRGFEDMTTRARALTDFYSGPTWKAHSQAANATMVDSDNVLLLRPVRPASAFLLSPSLRPAPSTMHAPAGLIVATIYYLRTSAAGDFPDWFDESLQPLLRDAGAVPFAAFVTEPSPNNFPRLPVREGENVFVWFGCFENQAAYERHAAALTRSATWREQTTQLASRLRNLPEVHRLTPAARSLLRTCLPTARR
ncbi:MAG TPA: NIPSNAP family protein [Steroidobacteraceae bacterium]|nr:NIPSNAP family protein [Steroidobacteraceae bacterium]